MKYFDSISEDVKVKKDSYSKPLILDDIVHCIELDKFNTGIKCIYKGSRIRRFETRIYTKYGLFDVFFKTEYSKELYCYVLVDVHINMLPKISMALWVKFYSPFIYESAIIDRLYFIKREVLYNQFYLPLYLQKDWEKNF